MKNREIKFRAWDESLKVMHNDFQFITSGDKGNDWIVFKSDKQKLSDKPHPLENPYFAEQLKIEQFIGLKDKNDKDIYENDIVVIRGTKRIGIYTTIIIWKKQGFTLRDNNTYLNNDSCILPNIEIIGNIHENKKLL